MKTFIAIFLLTVGAATAAPSSIPPDSEYTEGFFEGDIIPDINTFSGVKNEKLRWPKNQLVYRWNGTFTAEQRKLILQGLEQLRSKTAYNNQACLTFREATASDKDVIFVSNHASGCFSSVGRVGGSQTLNLANGCFYAGSGWGTPAHEFIHAAGYFHEQSRSDRDKFVRINSANIQNGKAHNFDKYDDTRVTSFEVPYDYSSLMHYGATAFSTDGKKKTIESITAGKDKEMGQRKGLTECDVAKLRRMYKCPGADKVPKECPTQV